MKVLRTFGLLPYFFIISQNTQAQVPAYSLYITFDERMDTTGFNNTSNFVWTGGLETISVQLIDTSKALLNVSTPEINYWYTLTVSNVYDYYGNLIDPDKDTIGCFWKSLPLPVELTSFTAKVLENKTKLKWITETEVNNYGFEIERKVHDRMWEKIGFVDGNGNSNSPKSYSFTDLNLVGGTKFSYRLKQVDTNGEFEYSEIVEVENIPESFSLYQNYPNPFNFVTKIRYQIPERTNVELKVFDFTGSEVIILQEEIVEAGLHDIELDAKDITSGVYFYQLKAGSFMETKKMILLK